MSIGADKEGRAYTPSVKGPPDASEEGATEAAGVEEGVAVDGVDVVDVVDGDGDGEGAGVKESQGIGVAKTRTAKRATMRQKNMATDEWTRSPLSLCF